MTLLRAAIPLALAVSAGACEGNRAARQHGAGADVEVAAEHVDLSRSPHTLTPEPYGSSPSRTSPSPDAAARDDSGAAVTSANETTSGTADTTSDDGSLVGEERDRDPRSDTVKIKVIIDARRQAHVIWGRKDFGVAPLELERPRDSGPLDLIVVAPGYLPLHARALTDRDDVLSLRLYSAAEAPQLLGYRPETAPAGDSGSAPSTGNAPPNSPQNKGEKRTEEKGTSGTHGDLHAPKGKTGDEKNLATKPMAKKQGK